MESQQSRTYHFEMCFFFLVCIKNNVQIGVFVLDLYNKTKVYISKN